MRSREKGIPILVIFINYQVSFISIQATKDDVSDVPCEQGNKTGCHKMKHNN